MGGVVGAFLCGALGKCCGDPGPEIVDGTRLGVPQQRLGLGEHLFNRVQIRRIGRHIKHVRADALDRCGDARGLVGGQVVHHDDIVRAQCRQGECRNVDREDRPAQRPVDDQRRGQGVTSQGGHDGGDRQMPMRGLADQSFADRRAAAQSVMFVPTQVSSMKKVDRGGSRAALRTTPRAPLGHPGDPACWRAASFLKLIPGRGTKPYHREAGLEALRRQQPAADFRRRPARLSIHQSQQPVLMRPDLARADIAASRPGRTAAAVLDALCPADRRTGAHPKHPRHGTTRAPRLDRADNAFTQTSRVGGAHDELRIQQRHQTRRSSHSRDLPATIRRFYAPGARARSTRLADIPGKPRFSLPCSQRQRMALLYLLSTRRPEPRGQGGQHGAAHATRGVSVRHAFAKRKKPSWKQCCGAGYVVG